jgi:hypothetical protein
MAKTGTPEAIDSNETKLRVSVVEGRAKISAEANSSASSSPLFQFVKVMLGVLNDLTKARRQGPSPVTTNRVLGYSPDSRRKALNKTSKLFSFDILPA